MLGTDHAKAFAWAKASMSVRTSPPSVQSYPSQYNLQTFYALESTQAGGKACASFNTPAELLSGPFKSALCGSGGSVTGVATADQIHTGIANSFGELFVHVLWMADSSKAYIGLI